MHSSIPICPGTWIRRGARPKTAQAEKPMTVLQNMLLKRMRPRRGVRSSVTVMNRKFIAHMTI